MVRFIPDRYFTATGHRLFPLLFINAPALIRLLSVIARDPNFTGMENIATHRKRRILPPIRPAMVSVAACDFCRLPAAPAQEAGANKKLFGKDLSEYDNMDMDDMLDQLTAEEIELLTRDVDPDVSTPAERRAVTYGVQVRDG